MGFTTFKVLLGIVSLAVVISLISTSITATPFSMELKQFQNISTCPTILEENPPLDKNDIPVYITNLQDYPDTFQLSLNLPEGWSGFISPSFYVDANQRKQVSPLWITVPDTDPGFYTVKIKAKSGQTGETETETFQVEVLSCHAAKLSIKPSSQEVCIEEKDSVQYDINITNTGKDTETYELSVLKAGQKIDWASFEIPEVTLNPDQKKSQTLTLDIPQGLTGMQTLTLQTRSQTSYASAEKQFQLNLKDCYRFHISLSPTENTGCIGETMDYILKINNKGLEDRFSISSPDWVSIKKNLTLSQGETKELKVSVTSDVKGRRPFTLTVQSDNDPQGKEEVTGHITAQECRNLALIVSPTEKEMCSGKTAQFDATVKNTGTVEMEIQLSTTLGQLEEEKFTLAPGEIKTVKLSLDTTGMLGNKTIELTASSLEITDQASVQLTLKNCYAAELKTEPQILEVCPCDQAQIQATLRNTGNFPDNYTLKFDDVTQQVALKSNQSKTFEYSVPVSCNMTGKQNLTIIAESENVHLKSTSQLEIKEKEICYSAELSDTGQVQIQVSKAVAAPIKVKNTGQRPDNYSFSVEGPAWTYLEPKTIHLKPGKTESTYLYVSPPLGTSPGSYSAQVKMDSDHSVTGSFPVSITVSSEKVIQPAPNQTNVTNKTVVIGPEGVTLNASLNQTVPAGEVAARRPDWRPIAIGVVTIIIIIVLIVRFVSLAK